jgi:hypothetical protein
MGGRKDLEDERVKAGHWLSSSGYKMGWMLMLHNMMMSSSRNFMESCDQPITRREDNEKNWLGQPGNWRLIKQKLSHDGVTITLRPGDRFTIPFFSGCGKEVGITKMNIDQPVGDVKVIVRYNVLALQPITQPQPYTNPRPGAATEPAAATVHHPASSRCNRSRSRNRTSSSVFALQPIPQPQIYMTQRLRAATEHDPAPSRCKRSPSRNRTRTCISPLQPIPQPLPYTNLRPRPANDPAAATAHEPASSRRNRTRSRNRTSSSVFALQPIPQPQPHTNP